MVDREININAKIANLQKIKEELSNLKVDIKFNSTAVDALLKASKTGLVIPIKFTVGPELKQLLDLQKNGININVGSGAKPLTGGNTRLVSEQESLYSLGKSNLKPDRIRAHLDRLDAEEIRLVQAREKQLKQFRARLDKANKFVEEDPLSALLGNDVAGTAASRFNVPRSSITSRPSFFNPGRLKDPRNLQNILFTTLLGGPVQGAGAAIGTATLGGAGALIGANIGAATEQVFERIADAMGKAVKAGAEYERAVTGITGIFQATSDITDRNGNPLPIREQLAFQRQRAEGIQGASQRALLPLGITGDAASALTKSFSAGLAQRGIAPDEKSTETILRRFGAAIQTLQPELAGDANALQRTVEDIIGGSPQAQRTELGSAIKGLAPDLFKGGIRTSEDIIRATSSLEELVVALKNNDTATVQYTRVLGSLRQAQQELGRGILEGLAPGVKALAEELNKPEIQSGLRELGKSIGEAGTAIIDVLVPSIKDLISAAKGGFQGGKNLFTAGGKAATGDFQGAGQDFLKNFEVEGGADSEGLARALLRVRGINVGAGPGALSPEEEEKLSPQDFKVRASIKSIISRAVNTFGIKSPRESAEDDLRGSAEFKLSGLQGLRNDLRARASGRNFNDVFTERIGLNSQEIGLRRQAQEERNQLFDQGDFGQRRRIADEKGGLKDQIKLAEENVSFRKKILDSELSNGSTKNEEAIAQARLGVQKAEEAAIKLRNEVADKEKELAERRLSIFQKQLSAIDQTTFVGKDQALNLSKEFNLNQGLDINRRISAQDAIINSKTASAIEIQAAKDRKAELEIQQAGNQSAKAQDARQGARNQLSKLAFDIQNPLRREAQADTLTKSNLELKQLEISSKELTLEQNKLTRATKDASKALEDFSEDSRLRELGAQGEQIAAAEAIVAAGGTVPAGISESLVKGTEGFDPEARAAFERRVAEEQFNGVRRRGNRFLSEEEQKQGELQDAKTGLGLDQEKLNLKPEELALQKKAILRDQKTQAIDNAQAAQAALEQDPENPQLQKEYQDAYKRLQGIKSQESSGALTVPQGPSTTIPVGKKGTFSINGKTITPENGPSGMNISYGASPDLIASNDIGGAILQGIGGSAYGRARAASEKGNAVGTDILRGLGKDDVQRLKEDREKGDRGNSIFDDLTALKPLTQEQMTVAFSNALQQNFV